MAVLFFKISRVITSLLEKTEVMDNCGGGEMVKNVFELNRGE